MIKYQNKHLQQKYESDASFRKRADKEEENYLRLLQKADSSQTQFQLDPNILEQFPYQQSCALYFWYGCIQPPPGRHTAQLTLQFLQQFRPKPAQPFLFVYFNHKTTSSDYFLQFKNLFLLQPLSILQHLRAFIIVKATRYIKLTSFVGAANSPLAGETYQMIDNCKQLCDRLELPLKEFVEFVPEPISKEFPQSLKKKRPSLTSFRVNLHGQTRTEEESKDKRQFQLSIEAFIEKEVYSIENFQLSELGIPLILQHLIGYFQSQPQTLQLEGIFRKSVAVDEQDQILALLRTRNYQCLKEVQNPYVIACLIKRFFYNLKVPVIPYPHYNVMLGDPSLANVKAVVNTLAQVNYLSLMFLLEFLRGEVAVRESKNKMNPYNLAVCFSQALMRSEMASEASILNAKATVNITFLLLSNFEFIFGDEAARKSLFASHLIGKDKIFEETIQKELAIDVHARLTVQQLRSSLHPEQSPNQKELKSEQAPKQERQVSNWEHKRTAKYPPQPLQHSLQQQPQLHHNSESFSHHPSSFSHHPNSCSLPPIQQSLVLVSKPPTSYQSPHKNSNQAKNELREGAPANQAAEQAEKKAREAAEGGNKLEWPLARRMEQINSQLKSIQLRFKGRKKSFAAQRQELKSIIMQGQGFDQLGGQGYNREASQSRPLTWKTPITEHYEETASKNKKES